MKHFRKYLFPAAPVQSKRSVARSAKRLLVLTIMMMAAVVSAQAGESGPMIYSSDDNTNDSSPYTVTINDGGVDSNNWTVSSDGPMTAGATVTLTYTGTKTVEKLTAVEATVHQLTDVDACNDNMGHEGNGTRNQGRNNAIVEGSISGTPWSYYMFYQGGNNSLTYYNNGTFKIIWSDLNMNGLFAVGYHYAQGIDYNTKSFAADFKFSKAGSGGAKNWIGVCGKSLNPQMDNLLLDFYIIEDWYNKPGTNILDQKCGEYTIDGDTYVLYFNKRNSNTSGDHSYFASVRRTARRCGHISISAHLEKWKELVGNVLGNVTDVKLGAVIDGGTGNIDFTYFRITDYADGEQFPVDLVKTGDNTWTFTMPADNVILNAAYFSTLTLAANGDGTVGLDGLDGYVDYHNSLQTQEGFNEMTVIDANGGSTWQFDNSNRTHYKWHAYTPGDDWLITPALQMKAGETYTVEFQVKSGTFAESFEVKAGTALTADNLSAGTQVIANTTIQNINYSTYSGTFTPTVDGSYYIGIHCTSVKNRFILYVQDLSVSHVMLPDGVMAYGENGKAVDGKYYVVPGTEVTVTATPSEGHYLSAWSGIADGDTNTDLKRTFTVGDDDMAVTATFTPYPVLTLAANGDGTVGLDGLDGYVDYHNSLQTQEGFNEMTVIDANGNDGNSGTWIYGADNRVTYYLYTQNNPGDDWLITPALQMKAGETYTVEFQVKSSTTYAESFEVKAGTALTADNLSAGTQVIANTTIQNINYSTYSGTFTPTADGSYYIGIHCTSEKNQFVLYVQDLSVSSGTQPAGVTAYEENGQTVDGKYRVAPGTEVTVTATPSEGHYLSAWSGIADGDTNTDQKRTFTVGDDDMTVTATFTQCPVLTLAANENGTVGLNIDDGLLPTGVTPYEENGQPVDGKYRVAPGSEVTVAVLGKDGYLPTGLTTATSDVSSTKVGGEDNLWTFTMPEEAVTVTAEVADVWGVSQGADGSEAKPFTISSTDGMDLLALNVRNGKDYQGKYFVLATDIDYKDVDMRYDSNGSGGYLSNYQPIGGIFQNGDLYGFFCGNFDGGGHTIKGITVTKTGNRKEDRYQGLFGQTNAHAHISHLTLDDSRITGLWGVGGIVGNNKQGAIIDCHVTDGVYIIATHNDATEHGGIVGLNHAEEKDAIIAGCTSAAHIIAAPNTDHNCYFGGIVGQNEEGIVKDCVYFGDQVEGYLDVGAIVGYNDEGEVLNCYFTTPGLKGITFTKEWVITSDDGIGSGIGNNSDAVASSNIGLARVVTLDDGVALDGTPTVYGVDGAPLTVTAYNRDDVGFALALTTGGANPTTTIYSVADAEVGVKYDGTLPDGAKPTFTVTKSQGGNVEVSETSGHYSFTMPTDGVSVSVLTGTTVSVAAQSWATFCIDQPVSLADGQADCGLYTLSAVGTESVTLSEITGTASSGTPLMIWNGSDTQKDIVLNYAAAPATTTAHAEEFVGTLAATAVTTVTDATVYVLYNNMFVRATTGSIPANRAYIALGTGSGARQLVIGNATGIDTTNFTNFTNETGTWYMLDGRRIVQKPTRPGVYIQDGRKCVVK